MRMRLLVVTHHFYGGQSIPKSSSLLASQVDPLSRVAALNESIVALNRHFGPRRHGPGATRLAEHCTKESVLDIIIVQVPGCGLLESIGIDPAHYTVQDFNGPPMMLGFEAQRILRERVGGY